MLEVLLWQPFVVSSGPSSRDSPKAVSEAFQRRAIKLGEVPERYFGDTQKMTSKPSAVRRVMIDLCQTELPASAGSKLTKVVMDCLNDEETRDASDENDLESGFSYIGDVLVSLGSVAI
jgi:hypothetical protein